MWRLAAADPLTNFAASPPDFREEVAEAETFRFEGRLGPLETLDLLFELDLRWLPKLLRSRLCIAGVCWFMPCWKIAMFVPLTFVSHCLPPYGSSVDLE